MEMLITKIFFISEKYREFSWEWCDTKEVFSWKDQQDLNEKVPSKYRWDMGCIYYNIE